MKHLRETSDEQSLRRLARLVATHPSFDTRIDHLTEVHSDVE
jgi:hypothetical protein